MVSTLVFKPSAEGKRADSILEQPWLLYVSCLSFVLLKFRVTILYGGLIRYFDEVGWM